MQARDSEHAAAQAAQRNSEAAAREREAAARRREAATRQAEHNARQVGKLCVLRCRSLFVESVQAGDSCTQKRPAASPAEAASWQTGALLVSPQLTSVGGSCSIRLQHSHKLPQWLAHSFPAACRLMRLARRRRMAPGTLSGRAAGSPGRRSATRSVRSVMQNVLSAGAPPTATGADVQMATTGAGVPAAEPAQRCVFERTHC